MVIGGLFLFIPLAS